MCAVRVCSTRNSPCSRGASWPPPAWSDAPAFVQSTWERVHLVNTWAMPLASSAVCWLKCHDPAITHGVLQQQAPGSGTGPLCLGGPLLREPGAAPAAPWVGVGPWCAAVAALLLWVDVCQNACWPGKLCGPPSQPCSSIPQGYHWSSPAMQLRLPPSYCALCAALHPVERMLARRIG